MAAEDASSAAFFIKYSVPYILTVLDDIKNWIFRNRVRKIERKRNDPAAVRRKTGRK